MEKYYYEEIIKKLIDEIDNRKRIEEELNVRINELMAENVRLNQLLRDRDYKEGAK